MKKSQRPLRPTASELDILLVLWERGPSTVREVHKALKRPASAGYTGTLKLMQIMAGKGLVSRDEEARAHLYSARLPRDRALRQLAADLLDRAFGGSGECLLRHLLAARKFPRPELARMRKLLAAKGE